MSFKADESKLVCVKRTCTACQGEGEVSQSQYHGGLFGGGYSGTVQVTCGECAGKGYRVIRGELTNEQPTFTVHYDSLGNVVGSAPDGF